MIEAVIRILFLAAVVIATCVACQDAADGNWASFARQALVVAALIFLMIHDARHERRREEP